MKRILMTVLGSVVAVTMAAAAIAQTSDPASDAKKTPSTPSASTKAPESTTPEATPGTPAAEKAPATPAVSGDATAEASAAKGNPAIDRVKERGLKASEKERAYVDKKLDEIEKQVENEATARGDAAVAGRIAGEFGVTADALTAERSQFSRGWGEILVAHTLLANAKSDLTVADVFRMRNEGVGWGVLAAGLDLRLGDVVSAVKSEGRVAAGLAKGDGKATTIRAGASMRAGAKAQGKPEGVKGGVTAGTGVGVGVDLNKGTGK